MVIRDLCHGVIGRWRMFESRFGDLGAAIIGTGFIGAVHADALRRLGVRVTGVVGSSIERAAGVAEPYASLEAMLADPP